MICPLEKMTNKQKQLKPHTVEVPHPSYQPNARELKEELATGAEVSLRPALPFPRLLLPLPDRVHTPRNTPAISL